jgi:large subunit ribosomal protein L23
MNPFQVLKKPIMSEKSTKLREGVKQYVFSVAPKATKIDVSKAIEAVYGVKVAKVQTLLTRGKVRRKGINVSLDSKTKKAVVTLVPGAKLPLFEDQ